MKWEIYGSDYEVLGTIRAETLPDAIQKAEILLDGIRPFQGVRYHVENNKEMS